MKRTEIIQNMIDETGLSVRAFARKVDLPPSTLRSMLNRGIGNSTIDNVMKVCDGLGITVDELVDKAKELEGSEPIMTAAHKDMNIEDTEEDKDKLDKEFDIAYKAAKKAIEDNK